jgi:hypothetical protein
MSLADKFSFPTKAGSIAFWVCVLIIVAGALADWLTTVRVADYAICLGASVYFSTLFSGAWYQDKENSATDNFTLYYGSTFASLFGAMTLFIGSSAEMFEIGSNTSLVVAIGLGLLIPLTIKLIATWTMINKPA